MRTLLSWAALATVIYAAPDDILRFTNGDQLHGEYRGMSEKGSVLWARQDLAEPLILQSENIRHIILHGAKPEVKIPSYSYVSLSNGDQIPGDVISLEGKNVQIRSHVIGEITLPTSEISAICPNPFGGKLQYAGPFSPEGWDLLNVDDKASANGSPGMAIRIDDVLNGNAMPPKDDAKDEKGKAAKKPEDAWQQNGSAWYHLEGLQTLARKNTFSEKTMVRFRLSWRDRLSAYVAIHADFAKAPEKKEAEKDDGKNAKKQAPARQPMVIFNGMQQNVANVFGNALVLNVYQSYFTLTRCGYDTEGNAFTRRIANAQTNVQLPDSGDAVIEIRSDRRSGLLMLFINGQYAAQWENIEPTSTKPEKDREEKAEQQLTGNGFAIQCTNAKSPLRLSDMVVADWNGIKDSAYSMSHENRDIILLTNGTDRYSGEITSIKDNKVNFKNAYSELAIPLDEISEIVFAKQDQIEPKDPPSQSITARFYPTGKITGVPVTSNATSLDIDHVNAQKLHIDLATAITLEFNDDNPFLEVMEENEPKKIEPKK